MSRCGEYPSWIKEKCDENLAHNECIDMLQDILYELSSINIVHCKKCKNKGTEDCPMREWNYTWGEYEYFNNDDDFCSCGERRV